MQAEFMGQIIISTPEGFKIAGANKKTLYPKTVEGFIALTKYIQEAR